MFRYILKKAVPVPKITEFNRFLFVGPHPDDIEVACGGTVARLTQSGKTAAFLIVTDGGVGSVDPSVSSAELSATRKKESLSSAKLLGVEDVRFLDYPDGNGYNLKDVTKDIVTAILDFKPQVIFAPDYTVPSECHPDHLNVGKAVTNAVFYAAWEKLTQRMGLTGKADGINLAYYYTHKPNRYVGVTKTYKLHLQAIACHKSQFSQKELKSFKTYFALRERRFGLRCGKIRAEGYRVLSPTHQHCFPEASEF